MGERCCKLEIKRSGVLLGRTLMGDLRNILWLGLGVLVALGLGIPAIELQILRQGSFQPHRTLHPDVPWHPLLATVVLDLCELGEGARDPALWLLRRAHHHVPNLRAAVLDLDARGLFRLHPQRAVTGRDGGRDHSTGSTISRARARQHAGHRRGGDLRLHNRLGEVLFASVLTDDATKTLAVGLRNYAIQSNVYWNQLMAAAIVVCIPVVAGFLALQRYLVQGIAAGGVKG